MKKTFFFAGIALCATLAVTSCKTQESEYKKQYEKAKAEADRAAAEANKPVEIISDAPIVVKETATTTVTTPVVRQERVTVQGNSTLKEFSVVVGAYSVQVNADAETTRLKTAGYPAFQVQNEQKLYRVVIGTFDTKEAAAVARDAFKAKYPDNANYQGAWILQPLR